MVYEELAKTVIERAQFLLEVQSFSKSSSGRQFDSICTEILKFVTAPIEDVNIEVIRNTLTSYPIMIQARVNGLKSLSKLLEEVQDPATTLQLLVPMSRILNEIPHIMCNGIARRPLNIEYTNLLQTMAKLIQICCSCMSTNKSASGKKIHGINDSNEVKNDDTSNSKLLNTSASSAADQANFARTLLSAFYVVSMLYRQVDVQVILKSGVFVSIAESVRIFSKYYNMKKLHLD